MKILELGKFYPPTRGGIETLLKSMCEGFARNGAEVECVVANDRAESVAEKIDDVNVQRVRSFGQIFSTSVCPGYVATALKIKADLWHAHFPNPLADLAVLRAPKNMPIVMTYHSDVIRQSGLMGIYGPLLRRCLARVDRIVVATPRHLEFSPWLQPVRDKVSVIPFGIDLKRFGRSNRAANAEPILLTVGRLVGYKGHRWLIEAMKNVNATLRIVGTGPLESELRQQSSALGKRVEFLGNISDDELPKHYQECDLFVLPSVTPNEAFGLVQLEAMACAKPVVSCDLKSGVPWVNQHGVTGMVVPPGDARAMAGAINTLLNNPAMAQKFGQAGRARVESEFTEAKMIERYYSMFKELMAA